MLEKTKEEQGDEIFKNLSLQGQAFFTKVARSIKKGFRHFLCLVSLLKKHGCEHMRQIPHGIHTSPPGCTCVHFWADSMAPPREGWCSGHAVHLYVRVVRAVNASNTISAPWQFAQTSICLPLSSWFPEVWGPILIIYKVQDPTSARKIVWCQPLDTYMKKDAIRKTNSAPSERPSSCVEAWLYSTPTPPRAKSQQTGRVNFPSGVTYDMKLFSLGFDNKRHC